MHMLEHITRFKKKEFWFVEIIMVSDSQLIEPLNKLLWGTQKL